MPKNSLKLYPAMKLETGDWEYYSVVMSMEDAAEEIKFASQVNQDRTLDRAIQRRVTDSRVRDGIVDFLAKRPDRFFSSLVVAAKSGRPEFFPIDIPKDHAFSFANDQIVQRYGFLVFTGGSDFYALDGQHRLKAIQALVDPDESSINYETPPTFDLEAFKQENISVLVVTENESSAGEITEEEWLKRYRRLFSSLNRYARKTTASTDIIMDEDDVFALVTRALVSDHEFFRSLSDDENQFKVETRVKNLRAGAAAFTSLETLYDMNKVLLSNDQRTNEGWPLPDWETDEYTTKDKRFITFRPDESIIEQYTNEVFALWDGILEALPELRSNPLLMRSHNPTVNEESQHGDSLLFWPIGQMVFIQIVRTLLDLPHELGGLSDKMTTDSAEIAKVLSPLKDVDWDLKTGHARGLLCYWNIDKTEWQMRVDNRKECIEILTFLYHCQLGLIPPLTDEEMKEKKDEYINYCIEHPTDDRNHLWEKIVDSMPQ